VRLLAVLAALALGQRVEVLRRLPELEVALERGERGALVFGGGALVRERGKDRVHYNSLSEREVAGDFLKTAIERGFISKDRDRGVQTEFASRQLREAERWVSRMAMLESARARVMALYESQKKPELSGALERLHYEWLYAVARCKRLSARRELAGVLTCGPR
jgi:hypothetical protein